MMPTYYRQHTAAENYYASWRECLVAAVLLAALGLTADAEPLTFNAPTPFPGGDFGYSVAVDGNHVLVGDFRQRTLGIPVGQAYLFDATTGDLLETFDDPTPTGGDFFGYSVALDGNNVLIGARQDNTLGHAVGQAHLFDATTGNLLRTFNDPTVTHVDVFGTSVAIDGNNVLIGASHDDTLGNNVGQAHLFDATTGSLLWTFNDPTPSPEGAFGGSVALDGNNVLVGVHSAVGQAHLFDAINGDLLRTFDDPTPSPEGAFGWSVALDGNRVLIGYTLGQAHLFDATTGSLLWTFNDPTPSPEGDFGYSVALDGNNVLIGARQDNTLGNNVGQAHLFDATTGNLLETFDDPTPTGGDFFGYSVALDGNNVLIGAHGHESFGGGAGQAYLFTISDVPEPASSPLLMLGIAAVFVGRRETASNVMR